MHACHFALRPFHFVVHQRILVNERSSAVHGILWKSVEQILVFQKCLTPTTYQDLQILVCKIFAGNQCSRYKFKQGPIFLDMI